MTMGLRRVRAAPAAAIAYLSVVWGALAGVFIFHEIPVVLSAVGALVICLGTMAVAASESWQQRHQAAVDREPPDDETGSDEEARLLDIELSAGKFGQA